MPYSDACRYTVHNFSGAHSDFKAALELDPSLVELASRLSQFEPTHATTRATHPMAMSWEASQRQQEHHQQPQLLVSVPQRSQQQQRGPQSQQKHDLGQQKRSNRNGSKSAAHAPPALLGYDPSQGPAPRGLLSSRNVAALQEQKQQRYRDQPPQPKTFTQAHRLKSSTDDAPFSPKGSAAAFRPTIMLPAIQGAEQTSAQLRGIRREPTPTAQDTKLWKHLKSGAQGNVSSSDGRASRARMSNDDGKAKFLWGSTARIQKLEDQKRAEAAEIQRRIASSR